MRILTLNIRTSRGLDPRHRWRSRRGAVLAMLRTLDPDVALLQEVRPAQWEYLARHLTSHHLVHAGRNDGADRGEMLVTAVRRLPGSFRPGHRTRWFSETPERPSSFGSRRPFRICLEVQHDGRTFVNLHLDEAPNRNLAQCARLLARWYPGNAILGGDFNAPPDAPELSPLWAAGYRDALDHLPPDGPGCATHHSFTGRTDGSRIDHILLPRSMTLSRAVIDHRSWATNSGERLASDHWPVIAEFEFPSVATAG